VSSHRLVQQTCGINRVRVCPQQPHLTAFWGDNAQVRVVDVGQQLAALAGEEEVVGHKAATKVQVRGAGGLAQQQQGWGCGGWVGGWVLYLATGVARSCGSSSSSSSRWTSCLVVRWNGRAGLQAGSSAGGR
jgi:hypothetical protein